MYISPYTEITTLCYHDHHRNRSITTHHHHVGDGGGRRNRLDHGVSMIVVFHNCYLEKSINRSLCFIVKGSQKI
jgi:hypothetical protein